MRVGREARNDLDCLPWGRYLRHLFLELNFALLVVVLALLDLFQPVCLDFLHRCDFELKRLIFACFNYFAGYKLNRSYLFCRLLQNALNVSLLDLILLACVHFCDPLILVIGCQSLFICLNYTLRQLFL